MTMTTATDPLLSLPDFPAMFASVRDCQPHELLTHPFLDWLMEHDEDARVEWVREGVRRKWWNSKEAEKRYAGPTRQIAALLSQDRLDRLLKNNSHWYAARCHDCKGESCLACGGSGDLIRPMRTDFHARSADEWGKDLKGTKEDFPCTFHCGGCLPFLCSVTLPMEQIGREVIAYRAKVRPYRTEDGAKMVFDPTPLARALVQHPTLEELRPEGREPDTIGDMFCWVRHRPGIEDTGQLLPSYIFDRLEGGITEKAGADWAEHFGAEDEWCIYPTRELAMSAPGRTMFQIVKEQG